MFLIPFLQKKATKKICPNPVRAKDLRGLFYLPLFYFYFSISLNLAFDGRNHLLDQNLLFVTAYIATKQGPVKKNLLSDSSTSFGLPDISAGFCSISISVHSFLFLESRIILLIRVIFPLYAQWTLIKFLKVSFFDPEILMLH